MTLLLRIIPRAARIKTGRRRIMRRGGGFEMVDDGGKQKQDNGGCA